MRKDQDGRIDFGAILFVVNAIALIAVVVIVMVWSVVDMRQTDRRAQAVAYTAGLCAVGGPAGAAFYCGNWGTVRRAGNLFYRCSLHMADSNRLTRHLRVAQFSTEEAAERSEHPTSVAVCDSEGRVSNGDDQRWAIPPLTVVK